MTIRQALKGMREDIANNYHGSSSRPAPIDIDDGSTLEARHREASEGTGWVLLGCYRLIRVYPNGQTKVYKDH